MALALGNPQSQDFFFFYFFLVSLIICAEVCLANVSPLLSTVAVRVISYGSIPFVLQLTSLPKNGEGFFTFIRVSNMSTSSRITGLILGEIHTSRQSQRAVKKAIEEYRPTALLHELLYDDICMTPAEIRQRLNTCRPGGLCDPRLNRDIYELGLKLQIPLVGIDLPERGTFRERESLMVDHITKWLTRHRVVVVVGDTHLRDGPIPRVPHRSLIRDRFDNDPRVIIQRAPTQLREVK